MTRLSKSQVLITVLIIVTATFGLGGLFLHNYSRTSQDITEVQIASQKAYSLAQSGIQRARHCLEENPRTCDIPGQVNLGEGSYTVDIERTIEESGNQTLITAEATVTGKVGKVSRTLSTRTTSGQYLKYSCGNWAKSWGTVNKEYLYTVHPVSGGYLIGGYTNSDYLLMKTDSMGNVGDPGTWARTYDGPETLYGFIEVDDGYVFAGHTWYESRGTGSNATLLKLDKDANVLWAKVYRDSANQDDYVAYVRETADGGYILVGYTESFSLAFGDPEENNDALVIKTDDQGNITGGNCIDGGGTMDCWYKVYGGYRVDGTITENPVKDHDEFSFVIETANSFILGGYTEFYACIGCKWDADLLFMELDGTNGDIIWPASGGIGIRTFGTGNWDDDPRLIELPGNTGYILSSSREGSFSLARIDNNFDLFEAGDFIICSDGDDDCCTLDTCDLCPTCWTKSYKLDPYSEEPPIWPGNWIANTIETADGGYLMGGVTNYRGSGLYDFLFIKTDADGNTSGYDADSKVPVQFPGTWARRLGLNGANTTSKTIKPQTVLHQTADGGYIIGGFSDYYSLGYNDFLVIRTDAQGYVDCCEIEGEYATKFDPTFKTTQMNMDPNKPANENLQDKTDCIPQGCPQAVTLTAVDVPVAIIANNFTTDVVCPE